MEQNESVRFRIQITAKDLWMFSIFVAFGYQMVRCDRGVPDSSSDLRADVYSVAASSSLYESGQTGKNQSRERAHGHDLQRRRDTDRTG